MGAPDSGDGVAFGTARQRLDALFRRPVGGDEALRNVVNILHAEVPHYTWVGIYLLHESELVLHNYLGRPTPHARIPVGEGVCGAAIRENDTIIVGDVRSDPRYLACSVETASEIVVPIRVDDRAVGEIDIDSDQRHAFGISDRRFLEEVAERLAPFLAKLPGSPLSP